jgi:hypothetical protein
MANGQLNIINVFTGGIRMIWGLKHKRSVKQKWIGTGYIICLLSTIALVLGTTMIPVTAMSPDSENGKVLPAAKKMEQKEDLYQRIQTYSKQHKVKPIDAKIDRVWKAIPGYNGLHVNVKESYKKMKRAGKFDETKVVL